MRIVQVSPRYPPHTGGVETHVAEISERLADRGHDVVVLTADAGTDVTARERRNGVLVKRHRGVAPAGAFHVAPGIVRAVRRERADVVHAHNYHSLPVLFAALGRGNARLIVTPHYHGRSADGVRDVLLSAYRPLGRWALRRADGVVAVSEWERDRLRADFDVEATVVPNGLDLERFVNVTPEERTRPYLLSVGRLEVYKGVQHLVRALSILEDWELVVAGQGPFRDTLERLARTEGVSDRTEFVGFVDDERLSRLYAGASVFANLSSFEAYGMTVAEALTSGTPCVVRDATALSDWKDTDGVVAIDRPTPESVARAVERVRTLTPVLTVPDWDDVTGQLEAIYRG